MQLAASAYPHDPIVPFSGQNGIMPTLSEIPISANISLSSPPSQIIVSFYVTIHLLFLYSTLAIS